LGLPSSANWAVGGISMVAPGRHGVDDGSAAGWRSVGVASSGET